MHVKYIVYYRNGIRMPFVDIWTTNGDMLHSIYAAHHDIPACDISSSGDLFYNFSKKRWDLNHLQWDLFDYKGKKRDKALVQKKIHETEFLKDEKLKQQCRKLPLFKRIFQNN